MEQLRSTIEKIDKQFTMFYRHGKLLNQLVINVKLPGPSPPGSLAEVEGMTLKSLPARHRRRRKAPESAEGEKVGKGQLMITWPWMVQLVDLAKICQNQLISICIT